MKQTRVIPLKMFLLATFLLLAVGITAAGVAYHVVQKRNLRETTLGEMAAIAELKVREISSWRHEQEASAQVLVRNPFAARAVRDWFLTPARKDLLSQVELWMQRFREDYGYRSIFLVDGTGRVKLSSPAGATIAPEVLKEVVSAPGESTSTFTSFRKSGKDGTRVAIDVFSIIPNPDRPGGPPVGFLVIEIDPGRYLFPYIQLLPLSSKSAETLLVERQGDEVVYLNQLRHRQGSALDLRFRLSDALPAAKAVLEAEGTMDGVDYRGVPVLAAFRHVPDSPWALVAKIDQSEVYAPLQETALLIGGGCIVLILLAGGAALYLVRLQEERARELSREELLEIERRQAEAVRESAEKFRVIFDSAGVGIAELTGEERIRSVNDRLCQMLGYSRQQLLSMDIHQLTAPEDRADTALINSRVRDGLIDRGVYDKRYLKDDGTPLWVHATVSGVRDSRGEWMRSIVTVEDISGRKAAEKELLESKLQLEELTSLLAHAPVLVRTLDDEIAVWNHGMEAMYGYPPQEAIGHRSYDLLATVFPQPREAIMALVRSQGTWQGELRHTARDGRHITVATLWVMHRSPDGRDSIIQVDSDITELKHAEAALRAGEERLRFATNAAQIGTWHWDLRTGIWSWSEWCKAFFGPGHPCRTSYEEAFLQSVHEEDRAGVAEAIEKALRDRTEFSAEVRLATGEGEPRWLLLKGRGYYNGDATALHMHGIAMDMTLRKEEELERRHLAAIVESTSGAVIGFTKDLDGTIHTWNRGAHKMYGYLPDEVIGKNIAILVPPGYPDDTVDILQRIRNGGTVDDHETVRMKKNGELVKVSVTVSPIKDAEGRTIGGSAIAVDITRRKQVEEELRRSEQQFRQLAEALPQLVWMTDAGGAVTYVNGKWMEYTGGGLDEACGTRWLQFLHPDDKDRTAERWSRSAATGEPYEVEYRLRRLDGEYHWFLARGLPLLEENEVISRWIGSCTDIEEQKHARDAAESAARTKSAFMANLSHEIRTPMNGILGVAELLLGTELDQLQRQYLDMIKHSGEALLYVVNDVLDFSKLEAGAVVLEEVPFELRETVQRAVENVSIRAMQKGIAMAVTVDPAVPPHFRGDPSKIRQVLLNLAGNAVKFTEQGEVAVHVEGRPVDQERWDLRFSVRDTGIGIPRDKLHVIFESFTQADSTISRTYGGTGLGLAISKKIVEQMGGRLQAESREGEGSTFAFTVSLRTAEPAERQPTETGDMEEPADEEAGGAPTRTSEVTAAAALSPCTRVLLVEDNPVNLTVTEAMLRKSGIEVTTARNGAEAVEAVEDGNYHVVLMDVQMPLMDGIEATRIIRGTGSTVPIIGLTAHAMEVHREECLAAGMDDYLSKPMTQKALVSKVSYWMRLRPSRPIHPERLLQQLGGVRKDYEAVVSVFVQTLPQQIAEIERALRAQAPDTVATAAHRLKGTLAVMTAEMAACLAAQVEACATKKDLGAAEGFFRLLQEEVTRVLGEMSRPVAV